MSKIMNEINNEIPVKDVLYDSRKELESKYHKQLFKMYGIFCLPVVVAILTSLCVTSDFMRLQKTWNTVETSNPVVVFVTALTCAMLLNVSMIYLGITLKKYSQKLCHRSEVIKVGVMSGATFLISYIFYFMFTMATRNTVYSMGESGNFLLEKSSNVSASGQSAILYIALYASFLPLATSLFSIVASYCSNNPLQMAININKLMLIDKQNNLMDLNQGLKEAETSSDYIEHLTSTEVDKHSIYIENLNMLGLSMTVQAAELIAKKLDTPEAYSELIYKTKQYVDDFVERYDTDETAHNNVDLIKYKLVKEGVANKFVDEVFGGASKELDAIVEGRSVSDEDEEW
ncbi:MAG: hypothetical protein K6E10_09590 [Eubacterium sp.]|nr:hypothetical protein [Eubacterium sp.]